MDKLSKIHNGSEAHTKLPAQVTSPQLEAVKQNLDIIARRHIDAVPEEDRIITTPQQMEIVLFALSGTESGSHLTSTIDKLGNLPEGFQEAFRIADRQSALALARSFAADPINMAEKTDKVRSLALSKLPASVKRAMLEIILQDGTHSAQQAFGELARRIEHDTEQELTDIIASIRGDSNFISVDADNVRRQALKQFLEGVYPDLILSPEIKLSQELQENHSEENCATIAALASEFGKVTGSKDFDAFTNAGKLEESLQQARATQDEAKIRPKPAWIRKTLDEWKSEQIEEAARSSIGLNNVMNEMCEKLRDIILKKFVKK